MWQTLAASSIGTSHLKQGKTNEDAWHLSSSISTDLILLASDGAGSAACAAQGSAFVVRELSKLLQGIPTSSRYALECYGFAVLHALREKLVAFSAEKGRPVKDFSATALAIISTPFYTLALQLGDGAIVVKTDQGLSCFTQGFHGEYASETVFVSSDDALQKLSVAVLKSDDIKAIALLTDGLESVALQGSEPFAHFFDPLFAFALNLDKDACQKSAELESFLASERISQRTHDDKTLVIAVKS